MDNSAVDGVGGIGIYSSENVQFQDLNIFKN